MNVKGCYLLLHSIPVGTLSHSTGISFAFKLLIKTNTSNFSAVIKMTNLKGTLFRSVFHWTQQ